MKIAIIDDLDTCREEIRQCLHRCFEENYKGELLCIDEYESGEDLMSAFYPEAYDMIFIDQYMKGLSGIDTARLIREKDTCAALVFVTTSREHAVDSYGVRACGYLVKPYTYPDFVKTMELAGLNKIRNARIISICQEKILLREILWCDQYGHYMQIHTDRRGVLRFRRPFTELAGQLVPYTQFLTCYKGCIVNMERIECIRELSFVMDTKEQVPFSKRDRKKIETMYHEWLFQREREEVLL